MEDEVDVYVMETEIPNTVGLRVGQEIAVLTVEQARDIAAAIVHVINLQEESKAGLH